MTATLMRLPLQFEANQGQVDEHVTFLARGPGYRLFLTPSESVLVVQQREPTTEPAQRERGGSGSIVNRPWFWFLVVNLGSGVGNTNHLLGLCRRHTQRRLAQRDSRGGMLSTVDRTLG